MRPELNHYLYYPDRVFLLHTTNRQLPPQMMEDDESRLTNDMPGWWVQLVGRSEVTLEQGALPKVGRGPSYALWPGPGVVHEASSLTVPHLPSSHLSNS